jgi:hypothetical protein
MRCKWLAEGKRVPRSHADTTESETPKSAATRFNGSPQPFRHRDNRRANNTANSAGGNWGDGSSLFPAQLVMKAGGAAFANGGVARHNTLPRAG